MEFTPPHSVAHQSGYYAGQIISGLILLVFVVKSIAIARRPQANTKCALSLLLLLSGWLVVLIGMAIVRENPTWYLVQMLASFFALAAIVASVVLAIIGLIECFRRRDLYSQGKTQAITALCLCGLFMALAIGGAVVGFRRARAQFGPLAAQPRAGEVLVFDDLNFKFKAPPAPWARLDAKKVNPYASLAFVRNARLYCMIIAEKGGSAELTTSGLVEIMKGNMRSSAAKVEFIDEVSETRNGLRGMRINALATVRTLDVLYSQWACATNGYCYQIHCWGGAAYREEVRTAAEEMISRFSMIDPKRLPVGDTNSTMLFESTNFPYRVDLRGSSWQLWPPSSHGIAAADFGALHFQGEAMLVVPVPLNAEAHWDAIAPALLGTMDIAYPSEQLTGRKEIKQDGLEGFEQRFERKIEGNDFIYRLRLLKGTNVVYLVAAWAAKQRPNFETVLDDGFARIKFLPEEGFKRDFVGMSSRQRNGNANVLNAIGLEYFNAKQFERSVGWFKAASKLNPTNTTFAINVAQAYGGESKAREALDFLNEHVAVNADPRAAAWKAYMHGQVGETSIALTNYARLFAGGFRADDHFAEYARLLRDARSPEIALREVENYAARNDSLRVRLLQAELLQAARNFTNAITVLTNLQQKAPFNAEVKYALAEARLRAELYNEALLTAQELIAEQGDPAYAYFLKGRSEYGLKWYRQAKESLGIAARKSPASVEIKNFLEHVSGMLGEANNLAIQDPIPTVALPPEIIRVGTVNDALYKSHGAYHVKRVTAISYLKKKEMKITDYAVIKVLDSSGVSRFSTIQVPFNPFVEEIFVNGATVKGTNGEVISEGRLSDYYLVDDTSRESASQKKLLNIPLSALKPGCTIEFSITRRDLGPPEQFRFFEQTFSGFIPAVQSSVYVTGDTDGLRFQASSKIQPQKSAGALWWTLDDPTVYQWEPMQTASSDFLPMLWIADSNTTWQTEAQHYLSTIADRLKLPPDEQDMAKKLTAGLTNDAAKAAAIARHVQKDYFYRAIEFGRRARVPQNMADFARGKHGDCKDHAVLLQQMLLEVGVSAHLALVNTRERVQTNLPSLDQFDHMIVYAPALAMPFLDCTDKGTHLSHSIPLGLAGKDLFVLDDKSPRFVSVPKFSQASIHSRREIRITNQTDAAVSETLTLQGPHASYLRLYLQRIQPEGQRRMIEQYMNAPSALFDLVTVQNIDEPSMPLVVQLHYELRKQFESLNGQLIGRLPSCWERRYLVPDAVAKRTTPFEISLPITFESVIDLAVPENFHEPSLKNFEKSFEHTFAVCKTSSQSRNHHVQINFKVEQRTGQFSPVQYSNFRDGMDRALGVLEQNVVFSKN